MKRNLKKFVKYLARKLRIGTRYHCRKEMIRH